MLYYGSISGYFSFFRRFIFVVIDYVNYGNILTSIGNVFSVRFIFIGVSGYSGDRGWRGEFSITLNLIIKFGELGMNYKFLIIDFSRNFLFLFYFLVNYE